MINLFFTAIIYLQIFILQLTGQKNYYTFSITLFNFSATCSETSVSSGLEKIETIAFGSIAETTVLPRDY